LGVDVGVVDGVELVEDELMAGVGVGVWWSVVWSEKMFGLVIAAAIVTETAKMMIMPMVKTAVFLLITKIHLKMF
jgi:hypothetical protein